jgi:hypothetical protein
MTSYVPIKPASLGNDITNLGVSGGKPDRQLQVKLRVIDPWSRTIKTTDALIDSGCMWVCIDERLGAARK